MAMLQPRSNAITEAALHALTTSQATSESQRILEAVEAGLAETGGGMLDSHTLADALYAQRLANEDRAQVPNWTQTKDYTQHVLREAPHVCRHADGHVYRIHKAPVCSPSCNRPHGHSKPHPINKGVCQTHFITLPATGQCDLCAS